MFPDIKDKSNQLLVKKLLGTTCAQVWGVMKMLVAQF